MQRDIKENSYLHPSKKELANFIKNTLDETRKKEIVKHLIDCDTCSDSVALVLKYGKNEDTKKESSLKSFIPSNNLQEKPKISAFEGQDTQTNRPTVETLVVNNSWFGNDKIRAIVLSGLVASFALFFILNNNNNSNKYTLGTFSITEQMLNNPMSATTETMRTDIIDGDEAIEEIEKSLDLNSLKSYAKAQEAEKNENSELAINLYYDEVYKEVINKFEGKEQLKGQIFVYNKIAKIYFETNKLKDSKEYQQRVKDWIQDYYKKYK